MEALLKSKPNLNRKPKSAGPDRRRQLVTIALDLIATKGFEGLRYQEVAKEAGINNATLFYYFSTKEELIQAVMQYLGEEFRKTPARPQGGTTTALEELRLEFESISALLQKHPKLFLVHTEISLRALRDPIIENLVRTLDDFWRQHLIDVIELGIEEGVFRSEIDIEATAQALMAQIKGIGFHAITGKLKRKEVQQAISEIANQCEHWLTRGTK
jgi:AcrR family transcriptional regulator